jgi:hypothetical protein
MRISMAPWASDVPAPTTSPTAPDAPHEVPNNTLGAGEPHWLDSVRASSERKIAEADGDLAKAESERPNAWNDSDYGYGYGYGYGSWGAQFGGLYSNPFFGGIGSGRYGLRGPVTTTTTHSDLLGSTAQRAFFDAAYPRNGATQNALDRAVQQFGRNATPPIARIQNSVDSAFANAQREHPASPAPATRTAPTRPARTR